MPPSTLKQHPHFVCPKLFWRHKKGLHGVTSMPSPASPGGGAAAAAAAATGRAHVLAAVREALAKEASWSPEQFYEAAEYLRGTAHGSTAAEEEDDLQFLVLTATPAGARAAGWTGRRAPHLLPASCLHRLAPCHPIPHAEEAGEPAAAARVCHQRRPLL